MLYVQKSVNVILSCKCYAQKLGIMRLNINTKQATFSIRPCADNVDSKKKKTHGNYCTHNCNIFTFIPALLLLLQALFSYNLYSCLYICIYIYILFFFFKKNNETGHIGLYIYFNPVTHF